MILQKPKNLCLVVSSNADLIEKIQTGLPNKTNEILRFFHSAQECRQFIDEGEYRLANMRIVVDTLIDIEGQMEPGFVELDAFSPSTQLMEYIHFTCPEYRILALTRTQCTNDARIALHHEPYWYCHSTDMFGWENPDLIENAFDMVEKFRDMALDAAAMEEAAA